MEERAHAAAFQACNQPETAASCHQAAAASQSYEDPVILPFTGKMLPLKKNHLRNEATTAPVIATTPTSSTYASVAAPVKAPKTSSTTINSNVVNSARKNLFLAKSSQPSPSDHNLPVKDFKQKEMELSVDQTFHQMINSICSFFHPIIFSVVFCINCTLYKS